MSLGRSRAGGHGAGKTLPPKVKHDNLSVNNDDWGAMKEMDGILRLYRGMGKRSNR